MRATGIVRRVDELGRVVIPIDLRRDYDINIKDEIEIYTEGDTIVLMKNHPVCIFCGEDVDITNFKEKNICSDCLKELKR